MQPQGLRKLITFLTLAFLLLTACQLAMFEQVLDCFQPVL
jgi:hypothetical protein